MPRVRRRAKRRSAGYDADHVLYLMEGVHFIDGSGFLTGSGRGVDEAAAREAWSIMRDELMAEWISAKPGTRPWAWWAYEATERRETVNGRVHPFDDKARTLHVANSESEWFWRRAYRLDFGVPSCLIPPYDADLIHEAMRRTSRGDDWESFEPEWSYLVRNNPLLPADSP
jgi:hypothetical protein